MSSFLFMIGGGPTFVFFSNEELEDDHMCVLQISLGVITFRLGLGRPTENRCGVIINPIA